MNRKNVVIIASFVILTGLLIQAYLVLDQTKNDLAISYDIMGLTLHKLSIKNYQEFAVAYDFAELVVGNEDDYCHAVQGHWNPDSRECLNVSEKHCGLITGSMLYDEETRKMGNCILK